MEIDFFKIYLDRLRNGELEVIKGSVAPEFLEIREKDLCFQKPVEIRGESYLTGDDLILNLNIMAFAQIPCTICSQEVLHKIVLEGYYHTEEISEKRSAIFDFKEIVRDAILLEVPSVLECCEGKCPERRFYSKYLKALPSSKESSLLKESSYFPFKDL